MSLLTTITNPENTSQFIPIKDSSSIRVNALLIHNKIPVTLFNYLLTFRDTNKQFKMKGVLLKMISYKNYKVDLAS